MSWFMVLVLACTSPSEDPVPPVDPAPAEVEPEPPAPEPLPDPTDPVLAASHIQVPWAGAVGASEAVERTESEAQELAQSLHERVAQGADFGALAREHSDDPSGRRGGRLGTWRTGLMERDFERCVGAAAVGELAPLCHTPFGWHVIRREPVAAVGGQHWSIPLPDDAEGQQAARSQADSVRQAWVAGTAPEGVSAVDPVAPGQLLPAIDEALRTLESGGVSLVVEASSALHVVRRSD